jgi:hypothetical protein
VFSGRCEPERRRYSTKIFGRNEFEERFEGWDILESRTQTFSASEGTRKDFSTLIAEKPSQKN